MALILSIETSTTNCSVALGKDGVLVSLKEDYNDQYSHAERLHVFIMEILEENKKKLSELDAIAISKGPGSYTGLRIGVSTTKGLCFSLDKPLISIGTLNSLAHQINSDGLIVPMLDARRMEVFSSIYNSDFKLQREIEAQILDETSFVEELNLGKVTFVGNGAPKFKEVCKHPNAIFVNKLPSAREMVPLAEAKYKSDTFEDVAYFEPFYLKDFVAGKKKAN
ncbi:tRNA (adenosine(37)-N6)-threonylcarbamoyltransferase complex dimerization subunit type 1 TsaB [Croceibacter atlanticus]|uniref:Putative glycoprotease family exported protein n=1 Tax=Croceibacter atlanticus (strain ATCC BAA-628 / JCM 21780 / CIP 108009 / IAM 15332 / KCTC 12090 / HTCC2559) TaxID=216432 RepID=A3U4Z2_CROAH|nr:tRNA (adenosine(37)-N6)-threonylcarbamoyltransferase complex dimerization subunit type 1 TsaB [Croceibacter atlanticus]EAP87309.1 putative glycoprotease family exported protein [Croceibacter atlanticus HTCC2559]